MLLRTVHSVLNRSPPHLLADIILVDDFSEYGKLCAAYLVAAMERRHLMSRQPCWHLELCE